MLKLKSPIMAADVPEALAMLMENKRAELLDLIIARCTIDEHGNPVPAEQLTLKDKMALVSAAAAELADMGNG
jgi:hypothetical protein